MTVDELIRRLESLKDNSESFYDKAEPDSVWAEDIEALEIAIELIRDYQRTTHVDFIATVTRRTGVSKNDND